MKEELKSFLKKKVVLDTDSAWSYIGILEEVRENCLVLSNVDVHNNSDTRTSGEMYILESKETGIKNNRECVFVKLDFIVSFSLLKDVKSF